MNYFSHETTFHVPQPSLRINAKLWQHLLWKLRERGQGERESGAFLLGTNSENIRVATQIILYDDLDPDCLNEGYVQFDGRYYGRLWQLCSQMSLSVVADVHTHPFGPSQSHSDKTNPMISLPGHVALIIPNYAQEPIDISEVGVYIYRGQYRWHTYRDSSVEKVFEIDSRGNQL